MLKIKKWIFAPLLILLAAWIFHGQMIGYGMKFFLGKWAEQAGYTLAYKEAISTSGKLTLIEPVLINSSQCCPLESSSIDIIYGFDFSQGRLILQTEWHKPTFRLDEDHFETLNRLGKQLSGDSSSIPVQGLFTAHDATLEIASANGPLSFSGSIEQAWGDSSQGRYVLASSPANSHMEINFNGKALEIMASSVDASVLSSLIMPLIQETPTIEFTKGVLDGNLSIEISDGMPQSLSGSLSLNNAALTDRRNNNQAAFESIKLTSSSENVLAEIELIKGSLVLKDSTQTAKLQNLKAHLTFNNGGQFLLTSEGFLHASQENSYLILRASGDYPHLSSTTIHLALHHADQAHTLSSVDIRSLNLFEPQSKIQLDLKNVRDREFLFTQNVLNSTFPSYNPIEFSSGIVSGHFDIELNNGLLSSLEAHSLNAEHLFFQVKPWEMGGGAQSILGSFGFKLTPDSEILSLASHLKIHEGEVELTGIDSDLWHFTNIETQLVIQDGNVQKSSASVNLGGLEGQAEILEGGGPAFLQLHFTGTGEDLSPFLPDRLQKGLEQTLLDDKVNLTALVSRAHEGIKIKGALEISSDKSFDSPPIEFGFSIAKLAPFLFDSPSSMDRKEKFFKAINDPLLNQFTPLAFYPLQLIEQRFLLSEVGFSSFTLKDGWIAVDGIQLDKFISPFLFPENEMNLSGTADLRAAFDLSGIHLSYRAEDVVLQNEALAIEVAKIGGQNEFPAFNRFDVLSGHLFGSLPLSEATYFDKDSGLLFKGVEAVVLFEGQKVHVDQIQAFSSGVYFAGHVDVDYGSPEKGVFDVTVSVNEMEGLFSEMQQVYSHFDKDAFVVTLPLESKISLGARKGLLTFHVYPEDFDFDAKVECVLQDGEMFCSQANLLLKEVGTSFYYDHQTHLLEFADLQAILLVGNEAATQEYGLIADTLKFDDLKRGIASFDLHVKDGVEPLLRLKGTSQDDQEKHLIKLDPTASHFCKIHPENCTLLISDWNRIDSFELAMPFRLSALLHDLQRFKETGLHWLSPEMIQELNGLSSASGDFLLHLDFKGDHGRFNFDLAGKEVDLDQNHFKHVHLVGYNRDKRWLIEQLELDEISMAAELIKESAHWKVDFLGIRLGEGLLIGLDGLYTHGDPLIRAHVNLFEVDLAKMTEWMSAYPILEAFQPKGHIRGTGEVTLEHSKDRGWIVDAIVDSSFKDLSWRDFALKDGEHVSCHFRSDKGITLRNLKTAFRKKDYPADGIQLDLNKAHYEFASQSVSLDDLTFQIESSHLKTVADQLHKEFPDRIDEEIAGLIGGVKQNGALSGHIKASIQPGSTSLELKLADGVYQLWDDLRTLAHFTLALEDDEIKVSTQYLLNQEYIWIAFRMNPDQLEEGEVILADTMSGPEDDLPLLVHWKKSAESGLLIDKVSGSLSGLRIDLSENPAHPTTKDAFRLYGVVEFDGNRARKIFPELERSAMETLLIGKGYRVTGAFEIAKEVNAYKERDIRFFGSLEGSEVELKGYQFKTLSAQVMLEPSSFQMLDFTLSDPAGTLHIGNISGKQDLQRAWQLSIPLAAAYDFRPSALREVGKRAPPQRKPLTVRQMYVQDITGSLGDSNSFHGHGNLYFDNPQKKNIQNTLFAIPAEILTRIGLNLSVLTPVSGTVHYEIQQGKIYLTKFKDVYSDRKISKFYLATSGAPSTIDFDGNLDIQVRFKQSTLLLKLVEMFMINVQGTLEKPTYSLQRQKYLMKEDLYVSTKDNEAHAQ
jgi:hypothetical protein